jgi:alpha-N-arabinofuranosidase
MSTSITYTNPIIKGFYPDPSVCKVGDTFYLVTSSFQYFPGVPLFKSKDLISWQQIGYCLTRESQLPLKNQSCSGGIYAPTIRYNKGRFYMVTTNVAFGGNFYVYTEDIEGEWSEPIFVKQAGIDPSLFFDEDGKVYFTSNGTDETGRNGIFQAEINIDTGELLTESRFLWPGTGGRYPEAPHLYKIKGMYYLMIAEGGTEFGHMVTIARSTNPYGPFESCPHNPILTHRNLGGHPIQGTGHGDLTQDEYGNWWMVFLGFRIPGRWVNFHHLGRETFLAPVSWSEDNWPVVYKNGTVELSMEVKVEGKPLFSTTASYENALTPLDWNYIRNPHSENFILEDNNRKIQLKGTSVTLNDLEDSPSFIGVRQRDFEAEFKAALSFDPKSNGEEAGITIYMNETHHYEIALLRENDNNKIIFRRRIGSLQTVVKEHIYPSKSVTLQIEASNFNYTFSFIGNEGEKVEMGTGETAYLSSEVAGGFTGAYFGLYATSNGSGSTSNATFAII